MSTRDAPHQGSSVVKQMLIAAIVFLGAAGSVLVGSSAGQFAGMLLAAAVAVAVCVLSPLLLRTRQAQPATEAVDGWRHVAIEMARSRRHRRSMAVIRVAAVGTEPAFRIDQTEVWPRLRIVDQVWRMGDDLYVLLPEADARTVRAFDARLSAELHGAAVRIRAAVFPDDGVTVGSLRRRLMTDATPAPIGGQSGAEIAPLRQNPSGEQAS